MTHKSLKIKRNSQNTFSWLVNFSMQLQRPVTTLSPFGGSKGEKII